jgi:lipopolysaccharide export system permease protein
MRILRNYIMKELIPPLIFGLAIFTFILLMDRIFDLTNLIVTKGVDINTVGTLLLYTLPFSISLSIPMALLMATLMAFGRLSHDNEITAMKASGINTYRIMLIPIIFALALSILMLFFNDVVVPASNYAFKKLYLNIIYKHPSIKLEEHTFVDLKDHRLYIEKINSKTSQLENIIIYKNSDNTLITAARGNLSAGKDSLTLDLHDGTIHSVDNKNPLGYNRVAFNDYAITLDLGDEISQEKIAQKSIREMNTGELKTQIENFKKNNINTNVLSVELYQRTAIPFACLAFVLIATPLGIKTQRGSKSIGFGLSLILIFIYYMLLLLGITVGEKGWLPPLIAIWIPNLFMGVCGIIFMIKTAKH